MSAIQGTNQSRPASSNSVGSYLADKQHQLSGILSRKTSEANQTAKDLYETGSKKAHEGGEKVRTGMHHAQHNAHLAAHRAATTSPHSIDWKKGLIASGVLAGAAVGAYFATTAAITITFTLTPAIALGAAAAAVALVTVGSLIANAFTKPALKQGVDELDVDTDVQAALNALEAEEAALAKKRAELTALASEKAKEGAEEEKAAQHSEKQAELAAAH